MNYIGLKGSGNDCELEILKETEKAYYLKDDLEREFWLPKSVFDDLGSLTDFGKKLLKDKYDNYEYKGNK